MDFRHKLSSCESVNPCIVLVDGNFYKPDLLNWIHSCSLCNCNIVFTVNLSSKFPLQHFASWYHGFSFFWSRHPEFVHSFYWMGFFRVSIDSFMGFWWSHVSSVIINRKKKQVYWIINWLLLILHRIFFTECTESSTQQANTLLYSILHWVCDMPFL